MKTAPTTQNEVPFAYVMGIITAARCYRLIELTKMDREVVKAQFEWEFSRSPLIFPDDVPALVSDEMDKFDKYLETQIAEAEDAVKFAVSTILSDYSNENLQFVSGTAKRIAATMSSCKFEDILDLEDLYDPTKSHSIIGLPSAVIKMSQEIDETFEILTKRATKETKEDFMSNEGEKVL